MRLGALALIVACAAAPSLMAAPRIAHAQDDLDRVVASVDGDPITVHDLKAFAAINKVTAAPNTITGRGKASMEDGCCDIRDPASDRRRRSRRRTCSK